MISNLALLLVVFGERRGKHGSKRVNGRGGGGGGNHTRVQELLSFTVPSLDSSSFGVYVSK